ncbi:AT-rich interactive domain-containing protein 4B-like isoform X2 [Scleropages formosus]|uniref:AT-rich interactive domain-containing protein 4B-like isoform X2 n=1 Tax=Scleropages formosus TaxID=113540 RepID=UPI0010FA6E09|nr:AT-rich interactive domain-containing protein 4B isoform X2 [Scleropages formosus]
MKTLEEPPYLTVGTDVSAKYRGAFCEAKIKTAKRLVKAKVTFKQDLTTVEIHDEYIRGPLKVGAAVEVKTQDGVYQEATINKLTDASLYTVVFDDGDEKTLRRSSLCLKGARHFAESETLDQLPLTNPEHFGTPVIGKKGNRGRRSNQVQEEESSSSSSEEEEAERPQNDDLLGKVVCVECVGPCERKRTTWYPALVISPDCSEEVTMKKDTVLVRSFKDGKLYSVFRKDVQELDLKAVPKAEAGLKAALDAALDFLRRGAVPSSWRMEVKEESSSSEEDDEEEEEAQEEDASSEGEEEEIEPFPEERDSFLQQLYKFMEDRGTPINKRPVLGYRNLNLFKLYRLVHKLGGFDNIDSGAVWKQVYQDLGIPVLNSAAGYNVKCAYRKYLYGFEEYCTSTGITFKMDLPQKPVEKQGFKEDKKTEIEAGGPNASSSLSPRIEQSPCREGDKPHEALPAACKEEQMAGPSGATNHKNTAASPKEEEREEENDENDSVKDDESGGRVAALQPESIKSEDCEEKQAQQKSGEDSNQEEEGEEFECYPPGMKVQVRYGRGRHLKTYEATVKESDLEGGEVVYLVHYCGWNVRYDEWVKADKIVRPANKNAQKVKHRKKIKNKTEREKDKTDTMTDREDASPSRNHRVHRSSKPGDTHDCFYKVESGGSTPAQQLPSKSLLNGLQASESSGNEESEQEMDDICDNDEEECLAIQGSPVAEGAALAEPWEVHAPLEEGETGQSPGRQDCVDCGKRKSPAETEVEGTGKKSKTDRPGDRIPKGQPKSKSRSSSRSGDWALGCPPKKLEDQSAGSHEDTGITSSSSSEDEEEEEGTKELQEGGQQSRCKTKSTPDRRRNGLKEKAKAVRPSTFWDVPDKRPKLALGVEERTPSNRPKGQKDVWSSIQAQWPKKTLKELFSDSDTEAAGSPPPAPPRADDPGVDPEPEHSPGGDRCAKDDVIQEPEKTREFPSSGSNSVLNTPPTTPESPPREAAEHASTQPPLPLVASPAASPPVPHPEESTGARSETDSSTVEVESLGGEVPELPPEERAGSPSMVFDASLSSSSNSSCSLALSSSSPLETEQATKATGTHKRLRDTQERSAAKKPKRSHKSSTAHPKKSRKAANSSDSEDLAPGERSGKSVSSRANVAPLKSAGRVPPAAGHKYGKSGDSDPHQHQQSRSSRMYKWSFQMSDLEKMSSLERISFLQEKLQDIRNHYLSLKSEVASIDRRRKRLKKKEREGVAAASSSSSSSSSPSSSSLTAAVMLTLAEPVSGSSQNSGVSVECR